MTVNTDIESVPYLRDMRLRYLDNREGQKCFVVRRSRLGEGGLNVHLCDVNAAKNA